MAHGAVFSGELVLSFFLQDALFAPTCVEIFASNFTYVKVCDAILDNPPIQCCLAQHMFLSNTLFHALRWLVTETLVVHLGNGKMLYIY